MRRLNSSGKSAIRSMSIPTLDSNTTTTDRNLYKEGDTVSIKGYVREFDAKANLLDGKPNKIGSRAYAVVQWLRNEQDSREIVELGEFNEYGAFVGELKVPDSVSCKLIVFLYC